MTEKEQLEKQAKELIDEITEIKSLIVYLAGGKLSVFALLNVLEYSADTLANINQQLDILPMTDDTPEK